MARYRVHYLKESLRPHFRQAPPGQSPLKLKTKDYQPGGEIEASSPYAAWKRLRESADATPLRVGDVLEAESGLLLVCRYAGFEEAQWFVPEPASPPEPEQVTVR